MLISPANPSAALLMSSLEYAVKHPSSGQPVAPELAAQSRAFLLARDDDPAIKPQSEIEQGTILALDWQKAAAAGDHDQAAALAQEIERTAPAFPVRAAAHAFAALTSSGQGSAKDANYRRYGTNLNFGVIDWTLPDDAKVAVIGDFGTGVADAGYLMQSIATNHPDIAAILHVGDIYDSGYYDSEVQPHFIKPIHDAFQQAKLPVPPIFAVPGDHEYNSGGAGFFQMITGEVGKTKVRDPINGKDQALLQQASYFCLRTKSGSWQFLGADTGFNSGDVSQPGIDSEELVWHQDKVENFKGRTVFLTHRQFVSAYDKLDDGVNPRYNMNLVNDMKDLLSRRQNGDEKISLMLWGHEHRFVPYVDGLPAPGYAKPIGAKMRLLGGSARETGSSGPRDPSLVMKNKSGTPILTLAVNPGKIWNPRSGQYDDVIFSNHSYAIVDLKAATSSYFEVTAWDDTTPLPFIQLTQPPALLVDAL